MTWFIVIALMFALFALNMRIYLAMFAAVVAYFVFFSTIPLPIAVQRIISPTQNTSLLAIPFFVLLGTLLGTTGIAARLLKLADLMVGRLTGGLGHTNVMLSTLMGGISASNLADAAMMCRILVPEMRRQGYSAGAAAAITACGSLITPIIPPGIALIIYALVADVSIGAMFTAGILPGLLCALLLLTAVWLNARSKGLRPSRDSWPTARETRQTLLGAWPALFLIVVIVGGIRLSIFTPTEAGAIATIVTLGIGFFLYREMKLADVASAFAETARQTSAVLLVIMTSSALAWIFSMERAGITMADLITSLTTNPWLFLLAVNALLLVLGMFIEGTALMIILVPLLKPVVLQLGIDPVHFGIVLILNLSIGTLTPPVGTVLLLVTNLTGAKLGEFLRDGWPFLLALVLALLVVTFIPALSLALV
ncbi:TRAP transporter large permease [Cereibacter azotoformans]|uniref:TRAP transporter large permease protein n=1 Tax=Cereibacter azotoformans TaxID=43057 RepID=A0A2T5K9V7_9RHOB|nr:TRAP transporter large permease [Cereibacter azotoformans]AXQ95362.1 TRAP transporter large permease [Cereibacter sphaeroides]PTR19200.1 tripartite ATP-independent transporter DctM subunit [Cereibacter azotoformans]UIJ32409.1 TRAP transporter large permease [Cereibacter azotoformans]